MEEGPCEQSLSRNYPKSRVFASAADLIRGLLHPAPDKRLGLWHRRELLKHPLFSDIDWEAVEGGTAPPPHPHFDRSQGFLHLLEESRGERDATISREEQALFADF